MQLASCAGIVVQIFLKDFVVESEDFFCNSVSFRRASCVDAEFAAIISIGVFRAERLLFPLAVGDCQIIPM